MSEYYDDEYDGEPDLYNLPTRKSDWSMLPGYGGGGGGESAPGDGTGSGVTFYGQGIGRNPVETTPSQNPSSLDFSGYGGGNPSRMGMDPRGGEGGGIQNLYTPFVSSNPTQPTNPPITPTQPGSPVGGSSVTNNNYTSNQSNSTSLGSNSYAPGLPQNHPYQWHDIDIPRTGAGGGGSLSGITGGEEPAPTQGVTSATTTNPQQSQGKSGQISLEVGGDGSGATTPTSPAPVAKPAITQAAKVPTRADTALGVAGIFSPVARKVGQYKSAIEQARGRISGDRQKRTDAQGNPLMDWSQY